MGSNGHNVTRPRVLLSGPAADGVATMLGAPAGDLAGVADGKLAETQTSADVALHVLGSSSVHGEAATTPASCASRFILAAYGEPGRIVETGLAVGAADVLVLPQPARDARLRLRKARRAAAAASANGDRGKVVTVFSPKGGAARRCWPTNLAWRQLARSGVDTLLIDLDLQFETPHHARGVAAGDDRRPRARRPATSTSKSCSRVRQRRDSRTGLIAAAAPSGPEEADVVGQPPSSRPSSRPRVAASTRS